MTKSQALAILNPKDKTKESLKKAFNQKAFQYHPDKGGELEMMKIINVAYDVLKDIDWTEIDAEEACSMDAIDKEIIKKWNQIKNLPGINGEIIGHWLWVHGNTRPYRKNFKELSFRWSPKKRSWYWHNDKTYRKRHGKQFSLAEMRNMWGKTDLKKDDVRKGKYIN